MSEETENWVAQLAARKAEERRNGPSLSSAPTPGDRARPKPKELPLPPLGAPLDRWWEWFSSHTVSDCDLCTRVDLGLHRAIDVRRAHVRDAYGDAEVERLEVEDRIETRRLNADSDEWDYRAELTKQRHRDRARRELEAERFAELVGVRVRRSAREFAGLPQAEPVIERVLAAEVNLLGGPQEAGKSLLARDWALHVAAGAAWRGRAVGAPRGVLWVASEGLHDFEDRWSTQPLWEQAADRVWVVDQPVNLVNGEDVEWLLQEYGEDRPGLVVFDVIYGMGMADDNGVRDVLPVLNGMKRISAEWGAATLALGHPGHGDSRRFRGSSMWRNLAYTEWHLSDGHLTCEKSKLADRTKLGGAYRVRYPFIEWVDPLEDLRDQAAQFQLIEDDIRDYPDDSATKRARRLAPALGRSVRSVQRIIARFEAEN